MSAEKEQAEELGRIVAKSFLEVTAGKDALMRFTKFLKTDNIDGYTAGGAIFNLEPVELVELYFKWLNAGEPEEGIGTQAG